ncbi:MAG: cysteine desulfurase-like protein [Candidatus Levybacteria bacterium]|nr:cysteine desulfurase-like protein [Candidatus Levybacteria bacterium]
MPDSAIEAIIDYSINKNGNKGGVFPTSIATDETIDRAAKVTADFINAPEADEIVFGANFTSIAFQVSRAISTEWKVGDEIVVTRLDHDANVSPWIRAAEDRGVTVLHADIINGDAQIDIEMYAQLLSRKTKLVAFCAASSSIGTRTDVKTITELAHQVGAMAYVDAVAYAPHGPIDVQEWGADFVGISAYKFFGPHVGLLWGKREHLERLPAYKIRPAPDEIPGKWMNGAQPYELLAGATAAMEYLAAIGGDHPEYQDQFPQFTGRRRDMKTGMTAIEKYENGLTWKFIREMKGRSKYRLWGIVDEEKAQWRVPTIAVSRDGEKSNDMAFFLSREGNGINIWSRSVYSKSLSDRLGLEKTGGFIRVGFVHYNTNEEVDRLLDALDTYGKPPKTISTP